MENAAPGLAHGADLVTVTSDGVIAHQNSAR
jgi:hypothetical protein